jgi:hypothetical protein
MHSQHAPQAVVRAWMLGVVAWFFVGTAAIADEKPTPEHPKGCEVGATLPFFYVRDVMGRRPDLATCLVCKYGARPVALVCVRRLDAQSESLIEAVDRTIDAHRGDGLRGFAMFLSGRASDLQPKLATLAHQRQLSLPLAIPVESGGPGALDLPEDAEVIVLLYRRKQIVERFTFAAGELTDERIREVADAADRFAAAD